MLFRALIRQEGDERRRNKRHVATQIDPVASTVPAEKARTYLAGYFRNLYGIDLYWGDVADFAADYATVGARVPR